MKFLGEPIFTTPPTTCSYQGADCPEHGFGLTMERAAEIVDALVLHAQQCRSEEAGTVDFPRFMAGPDLDLQTPAEVLYAGAYLMRVNYSLQHWLFEASGTAALHSLMVEVNEHITQRQGPAPQEPQQ